MKIIPSGIQNFIEFVIEAMYNTCKKIAGEEKGKIFFPLVMTIFLFIVISNWIGVLPGTGTLGRIETAEEYCHHQKEKNKLGDDLEYNSIPEWDSVGHMGLIAELEEVFDIMMEMDDIIDFSSYKKGFELIAKYGVEF